MSYFTTIDIPDEVKTLIKERFPDIKRQVIQYRNEDDTIIDWYLEGDFENGTKNVVRFSDTKNNHKWWEDFDFDSDKHTTITKHRYQKITYRRRKKTPRMIERISRLKNNKFGQAASVSREENDSLTVRVEKAIYIDHPEDDEEWVGSSRTRPRPDLERVVRVNSSLCDDQPQEVISPVPDKFQIAKAKKNARQKLSSSSPDQKYVPPWKRKTTPDNNSSEDSDSSSPQKYDPIPLRKKESSNNNQRARQEKSIDTLRVHNLAGDMDRYEILDLFRPFGRVRKVHIVKNSDGESQYAFIHYDFQEEARKAMESLNNKPIAGRGVVLSIEWANRK